MLNHYSFVTDIVMPSAHLPVPNTNALPEVSVDGFLLQVLTWNPNWLSEYGTSKYLFCIFAAYYLISVSMSIILLSLLQTDFSFVMDLVAFLSCNLILSSTVSESHVVVHANFC